MYCHYIDWCIGKCPLYRGVLYSECPLSEVPLYTRLKNLLYNFGVILERYIPWTSVYEKETREVFPCLGLPLLSSE